jgi:hypothetical protein
MIRTRISAPAIALAAVALGAFALPAAGNGPGLGASGETHPYESGFTQPYAGTPRYQHIAPT